jgi:hypothetical protein
MLNFFKFKPVRKFIFDVAAPLLNILINEVELFKDYTIFEQKIKSAKIYDVDIE